MLMTSNLTILISEVACNCDLSFFSGNTLENLDVLSVKMATTIYPLCLTVGIWQTL